MRDTITLLQEGLAQQRAGRFEQAETIYLAVLHAEPGEPNALHYLGLTLLASGRAAQALSRLSQAIAASPDHDLIRIAFAHALVATGRAQDAVALLHGLATSRPLSPLPRASLAVARLRAADPAGALRDADMALDLDETNAQAWFARGTALSRLRLPLEAVAALEQAVARSPEHAEAWLNLGNALLDLDRRADAERAVRRAVAFDPALAEAHASLGCLLSVDGSLAEAVACCTEAIALKPDFAQAYWNRSFAHLLAGDYARGWEDYEWRKRHDVFARHLMVLPGREWRGESLAGQTLLVRAEQGLGDTIQFARYLPSLVARGGKVVLACAPPLLGLLSQFGGVSVVPLASNWPDYDCCVDQMSLPRIFATEPGNIPSPAGYFEADPSRVACWRQSLPDGFRVGLVWAGNPMHSNDARRSLPVAALAALLSTPDCRFVSLQVGPRSAELAAEFGIEDRSPALVDLAETAALVASLDLVVSVDSCVAHLAGALGVPCWVLLPFAADWRWMVGRTTSPWYDAVRLFRQRRAGDWAGPIADAAAALRSAAAGSFEDFRPRVSPPPRPAACG